MGPLEKIHFWGVASHLLSPRGVTILTIPEH